VTTPASGAIKWAVTSSERPKPDLEDADTGQFWVAAQEHRLTYGVCRSCEAVIFYPRDHCTTCLSEDVETRDSAGKGTIYSYTVIRRNPDPAFSGNTPYVVALVDLAEGFRLLTHIKVDPDSVRVGQPVSLSWETVDGIEVPVFEVVAGEG
jgi:hypothetical protein